MERPENKVTKVIKKCEIKRIRLDRGWTIADMAKHLGVNDKTVENWENGKLKPKLKEENALWELDRRFQWPTSKFLNELAPALKSHCGGQTVKNLAKKHEIANNTLLRLAEMLRDCSGLYDERINDIAEQRDLFEAMLKKVLNSKQLSEDLGKKVEECLYPYRDFQNIDHGFPSLKKKSSTAISSALTKVDTPNPSGNKSYAAELFPAPLGPPIT